MSGYLLLNQAGWAPPITRDQVMQIQTGFCNLHDSVIVPPSPLGRPIFHPYFMCLPLGQQREWLTIWKYAKYTHVVTQVFNPIYNETLPQYGTIYPAPSFDPTQAQFNATMQLIRSWKLIPIVFLTDGNFPPDWDVFLERLGWLTPWRTQCVAVEGWEPYWSNAQQAQVFAAMRATLGEEGVCALHLPTNYCHNGGGPNDWLTCFAEVDVFLQEVASPTSPDAAGVAAVSGGWQELLCRMLPPGTVPGPGCPYYLAGRPRPLIYNVFESKAYPNIRDFFPDSFNGDSDWLLTNGVTYLGNKNIL